MAATRLAELESTNSKFKESLKEVEKLRMELSTLPEHVVVETTEHKCLQSQFSVLYNEAMQLKTQLEESRAQLQSARNTHMRQIEQMEAEELLAQKKLRTEVIQLEDMLAQVSGDPHTVTLNCPYYSSDISALKVIPRVCFFKSVNPYLKFKLDILFRCGRSTRC